MQGLDGGTDLGGVAEVAEVSALIRGPAGLVGPCRGRPWVDASLVDRQGVGKGGSYRDANGGVMHPP